MRLCPVAAKDIPHVWPHIDDFIEASCDAGTGELNSDLLFDYCREELALLSVVVDGSGQMVAAVVTQMVIQPDEHMACLILACGGQGMKHWIGLIKEIEEGARKNGATQVRFLGRVGWSRVLPDYRIRQVVFAKDLRH